MLGFMIDGHHRTEGAYEAGCLSFQFPTTIYADLNLKKMAGSFAGINCYQEKPSAIHTNAIRNLSGLMTNTENDAFLLMTTLNDGDTILHERIKMYDGPRIKGFPAPLSIPASCKNCWKTGWRIFSRLDLLIVILTKSYPLWILISAPGSSVIPTPGTIPTMY